MKERKEKQPLFNNKGANSGRYPSSWSGMTSTTSCKHKVNLSCQLLTYTHLHIRNLLYHTYPVQAESVITLLF
jgi:hypothetical protein